MSGTYYKDHWTTIEPDRVEPYKQMFQWSPASEPLLAPAKIEPGQPVADLGCGPGFIAVELAKRVGPRGHVHAIDVNTEFTAHAEALAREQGVADRITVHHVSGSQLPLGSDGLTESSPRTCWNMLTIQRPVLLIFIEFLGLVESCTRSIAIGAL